MRLAVSAAERWLCSFPSLQILLFLSGFLFFRSVRTAPSFLSFWRGKLRRRIPSLLVPFLLWNLFAIAWRGAFHKLPATPVWQWIVGCDGWASHPIGNGLWFIKSLLVFSVAAPLYFGAFRILGKGSVLVAIYLALRQPVPLDFPVFSPWLFLGGCLAYNDCSLRRLAEGHERILVLSTLGMLGFATLRAFEARYLPCASVIPYLLAVSMFAFLCKRRLPDSVLLLFKGSTFLYFSHFTVSSILREAIIRLVVPKHPFGAVVLYAGRVLLTVIISVFLFFLLKRICPKMLSVAIGERC